jgi:hypothetical protein
MFKLKHGIFICNLILVGRSALGTDQTLLLDELCSFVVESICCLGNRVKRGLVDIFAGVKWPPVA